MHRKLLVAIAAVGLFAASSAHAALTTSLTVARPSLSAPGLVSPGFDIVLSYVSTPTPAQAAAFAAAEAQWESYILGYKSNDISNNRVDITVDLRSIDGINGVLGQAGPQTVKVNAAQTAVNPTYLYTQSGEMVFDTADVDALITGGLFNPVVLHEMGHVLGIGTLWSSSAVGFAGRQELYAPGSGQYTGSFGVAAYNAEFAQTGTFIPVELDGGPGTAEAHWDEVAFGAAPTGRVSLLTGQDMAFELMTGWLNPPTFVGQLTIQGMQDLGYITTPIPEPTGLAIAGVAIIGLLRRSRR
jgi:hypothetical protein